MLLLDLKLRHAVMLIDALLAPSQCTPESRTGWTEGIQRSRKEGPCTVPLGLYLCRWLHCCRVSAPSWSLRGHVTGPIYRDLISLLFPLQIHDDEQVG